MEKRIKLGVKKLETLKSIEEQKKQLDKQFQILNQNEGLVLSFIYEDNNVDPSKIKALKLEEDELVIEFKEEEVKKKK